MKNKLLNTLIGFLILITLLYSKVLSQEFSFEAGNIQNINEKVIKASEKVFISDNKGIKVKASNVELSETAVIDFAKTKIASYKVPKKIVFIEALPRNPSGKILRRELRDPYWEGRTRGVN